MKNKIIVGVVALVFIIGIIAFSQRNNEEGSKETSEENGNPQSFATVREAQESGKEMKCIYTTAPGMTLTLYIKAGTMKMEQAGNGVDVHYLYTPSDLYQWTGDSKVVRTEGTEAALAYQTATSLPLEGSVCTEQKIDSTLFTAPQS